jgi:hypothetical protein
MTQVTVRETATAVLLKQKTELRKENEFAAARNLDMSAQVRELEARLKDRDDQLFLQRKDLDQSKMTNNALRGQNVDNLAEKDALEKHAQVVQL